MSFKLFVLTCLALVAAFALSVEANGMLSSQFFFSFSTHHHESHKQVHRASCMGTRVWEGTESDLTHLPT